MKLALPLLVAALVAAFLLFFRSPAPGSEGEATRVPDPVRTAHADDAPLEGVSREGEAAPARSAVQGEALAAQQSPRGRAPQAEGKASAPASITGRLTDVDGAPLTPGDVEFRPLDASFYEDRIRARVDVESDGRFQVELEPGAYRLVAGADDYAPLEREFKLSPSEAVDLGDLRLTPGARIRGRVVDEDGKPVSGARIRRVGDGMAALAALASGLPTIAESDDEGRFELTRVGVGAFHYRVTHRSYPSAELSGSVERAGTAVEGVEVILRIGATIEGKVTGLGALDDEAREGLCVIADQKARADGSAASPRGLFGTPNRAALEPDGAFVVRGLEAGSSYALRVEVAARPFDPSGRRSAQVLANAGDRGITLDYSEGATLRFRLVDEQGAPLSGARIATSSGWAVTEGKAQEPVPGSYEVPQLWPTNDDPIEVTASLPGYEDWTLDSVPITGGRDVDLGTITMAASPLLVVTVLDQTTGDPVVGARVTVEEVEDAEEGFSGMSFTVSTTASFEGAGAGAAAGFGERERTDAEGKVRLDVEPGARVNIDVLHPDYAEARVTRVLASSKTSFEETVQLTPGGNVRVRLVDDTGAPITGRYIDRRTPDGAPDARPVQVDGDGVALFEGLAPGTHGFRLGERVQNRQSAVSYSILDLDDGGGDGDGWVEVEVLPGETAELALVAPRPSVLEGVVLENGEPLAGARLTAEAKIPGMQMLLGMGGGAAVTSDARGEYRIEDLEAGECVLSVEHPTRSMPAMFELELEQGTNEHEAHLDVTTVVGRVVNEAGEPLARVRVRASKVARGAQQSVAVMGVFSDDGGDTFEFVSDGAKPALTDEDGRYELRGVAADVPLRVVANRSGGETARSEVVEVPAGGRGEASDIRFETAGTLVIEIEGYGGRAMAVLNKRGESPRTTTIDGGRGTISNVTPGTYQLVVTALSNEQADGGGVELEPATQEVEIVTGETATATVRPK